MACEKQQTNPVKAIRAKCIDCCCGVKEVELCTVTACQLHPFRLGKNPFRKRKRLSAEQKQKAVERLKSISK